MPLPSSVSTRLQYQHKSLLDIIDQLSDEQIRLHVHEGKWSIFENIVHIETYQHIFISRIRQILDSTCPSFEVYNAENDPLFHDHCKKSSHEVIHDLLTLRKELAAGMLGFTEEDLVKTGSHAAYGDMTLVQWLHFFLLHEAHHLLTIFKLAAELKKAG